MQEVELFADTRDHLLLAWRPREMLERARTLRHPLEQMAIRRRTLPRRLRHIPNINPLRVRADLRFPMKKPALREGRVEDRLARLIEHRRHRTNVCPEQRPGSSVKSRPGEFVPEPFAPHA